MIRRLALTATLMATALPAAAQSTFERFEVVTVAMNALSNTALVMEIPALEGRMPAPEWDDGLRVAYTCMYDAYITQAGAPAVDAMVATMESRMETMTAADILENGATAASPEGMSDNDALNIVAECEVVDAFMARLDASGAMEILMQENP